MRRCALARNHRKPLDALDQHVDLIRWWSRSVYAPTFAEGFAETHPAKIGHPLDRYLVEHLDRAATIFVTSTISNMLWEFAQDHDMEDNNLYAADLFLDDGYVWFEQPLIMTDVRGRIVTLRALCWFRDTDRLRVFYFNDKLHPLDELTKIMYDGRGIEPGADKVEPRTPLFHFDDFGFDQPMFSDYDRATTGDLAAAVQQYDMAARLVKEGARLRLADDGSGAWYYTYNFEDGQRFPTRRRRSDGEVDPYEYAIDPDTGYISSWFTEDTLQKHLEDMRAVNRFLIVLWQYMGEHLPGVANPDRPRRRALARAKLGIPGEVLVIDLRVQDPDPFYQAPEYPALVMWTHRWRSRGHWRRYRNKRTGEVIKRVWVRGSIKGPAHLQLIEKDTVYNVRR